MIVIKVKVHDSEDEKLLIEKIFCASLQLLCDFIITDGELLCCLATVTYSTYTEGMTCMSVQINGMFVTAVWNVRRLTLWYERGSDLSPASLSETPLKLDNKSKTPTNYDLQSIRNDLHFIFLTVIFPCLCQKLEN